MKLSDDIKLKIIQASIPLVVLYTLVFHWSLPLLISGLVLGWFFGLAGVYGSLHRYTTHRSFTPKNDIVKAYMLFMGVLTTLGSGIGWAAMHRTHHRHSDSDKDPHSIYNNGGGPLQALKIWFFYFPKFSVEPKIVRDLTVDKMQKFFHRNYFKILFSYIAVLFIINPVFVGYFYALPVAYTFLGINFINVITHWEWLGEKIGYRNFETSDKTYNHRWANYMFPGEGNHNNHHANPSEIRSSVNEKDIDTGLWYIKLIGKIEN